MTTLDHGIGLPSRWPRAIGIVVFTAVALGFGYATFHQVRVRPGDKPRAVPNGDSIQGADFGAYYRAGLAADQHQSPYVLGDDGEVAVYVYAPAFAYGPFRLLARLPYLSAVRVFLVVNWLATIGVVWLSLRLLVDDPRRRLWAMILSVFSAGDYLYADLHNGQVATLLVLCCVGWLALTKAGRPILGGVVLSIAIGLKIYPALLLLLPLLRRDWNSLAGVAIGLSLLFLVPVYAVGFDHLYLLHHDWLTFCLKTQSVDQTIRTGNQSLLAILARLPWVSDGTPRANPVALATLSKWYPPIVLILSAALYAALWSIHRARRPAIDLAVLMIWITLASPRAWTFNFAAEIPAAIFVADYVLRRRPGWPVGIFVLLLVLAAIVVPTNAIHFSAAWSLPSYVLRNHHFDAAVALIAAAVTFAVIDRKLHFGASEAANSSRGDSVTSA